MGIKKIVKAHFSGDEVVGEVGSSENSLFDEEQLWFVAQHKKGGLCDLSEFRTGVLARPAGARGKWAGTYRGRPVLIAQMFHALRELNWASSVATIESLKVSLRAWWRFFDRLEDGGAPPIQRVEDLIDAHGAMAFTSSEMVPKYLSKFANAASLTRQALGLSPLHWYARRENEPDRHLPVFDHVKAIRTELKHRWFRARDRWALADELRGRKPTSNEETYIREHMLVLDAARLRTGKAWPTTQELELPRTAPGSIPEMKYSAPFARKYAFPDREDVKAGFHLSLVGSGWNASTLLDFDVTVEHIRPHPKDPRRYVMWAFKERSKSDQFTQGLYRTESSPGAIVLTLIERTAPLREQLREELTRRQQAFAKSRHSMSKREIAERELELAGIALGLKSPWMFADEDGRISWLDNHNWSLQRGEAYIPALIAHLNSMRFSKEQIPRLTASDFRDAYAAYVFEVSGGLVYAVKRALGHKHLTSTQKYLKNRQLTEISRHIYLTFTTELFNELATSGRVDPTILTLLMQFREVTAEERKRLSDYRTLTVSRIGVACKRPTHPPPKVAPGFVPDGVKNCPIHRCTLCIENAVITKESLDGLAMRWAELTYLQKSIAAEAFTCSSFAEELENIDSALAGFDSGKVAALKASWQAKIIDGSHRPIVFEFMAEAAS